MILSDLTVGNRARIISIAKGNTSYRNELLSLGLLPGSVVTLIRKAPLGDPLQIEFKNSSFALRKEEADLLSVEKIA